MGLSPSRTCRELHYIREPWLTSQVHGTDTHRAQNERTSPNIYDCTLNNDPPSRPARRGVPPRLWSASAVGGACLRCVTGPAHRVSVSLVPDAGDVPSAPVPEDSAASSSMNDHGLPGAPTFDSLSAGDLDGDPVIRKPGHASGKHRLTLKGPGPPQPVTGFLVCHGIQAPRRGGGGTPEVRAHRVGATGAACREEANAEGLVPVHRPRGRSPEP